MSSNDGSTSGEAGSRYVGCAPGAQLIYTIDSNLTLSSFDPTQMTFHDIGSLHCPTGSDPFSMSVDRSATAWVLYGSGDLYRVATASGDCMPTNYAPAQQLIEVFGMGFVSNSAGAAEETLYIAGGLQDSINQGFSSLGRIDTASLQLSKIAQVNNWPELTGTGDAKLWGFFPSAFNPRVSRIDQQSGAEQESFPLDGIDGTPQAWAFAFWGGDFWLFLMRSHDDSTNVYRVDGKTGSMQNVMMDTGRRIVGAGVSTCAPISIK
jgi:hypothetical protein